MKWSGHWWSGAAMCAMAAAVSAALVGCGEDQRTTAKSKAEPTGNSQLVGDQVPPGGDAFRPEIGQVFFSWPAGGINSACGGTLVDTQFVITAGHCVNYTSGSLANTGKTVTFLVGGSNLSFGVDVINLGTNSGIGNSDVAILHLNSPVPSWAAVPTQIAAYWASTGSWATIFGFGCHQGILGNQAKQYWQYIANGSTQVLEKGDSGSPIVLGGLFDNGPVYAVNSGAAIRNGGCGDFTYPINHDDLYGDAVNVGRPLLTAAQKVTHSVTTNLPGVNAQLASWGTNNGVRAFAGHFVNNSSGTRAKSDIALVGGAGSGWNTIVIAQSTYEGAFNVVANLTPPNNFAGLAQSNGVKIVAGDFNGDGLTDIALLGGQGWSTIFIAYSAGNGSFYTTTNQNAGSFASWAQNSASNVIVGDFDGDGRDDLALTGSWLNTVPVAYSNGNGTFSVQNQSNAPFTSIMNGYSGTQAIVGDFDGDGFSDVALVGGQNLTTIPVFFGAGRSGVFTYSNPTVDLFPNWARNWVNAPYGKFVAGDFDGDGKADIAYLGGPDYTNTAFAFSASSGRSASFAPGQLWTSNIPGASTTDFTLWGAQARYAVAGDFQHDGQSDIALFGGSGFQTVPVLSLKR